MNYIDFEWDFNKAESNLLKHGIAFEEAITVLLRSPSVSSIWRF